MIRIDVTGLDELLKTMGRADKQVRFAASRTLNQLAQLVIKDIRAEMQDSFDRPTPWTLRGFRQYGLATRDRLETTVDFKYTGNRTPEQHLLVPQVYGGERRLKRFEYALRSAGVLPGGYFIVRGQGAAMDAYGNISRGQVQQILSWFRGAELTAGRTANSTAATRARKMRGTKSRFGFRYFVGRPGDGRGPLGVYQVVRIAPGVTEMLPVLIFVRSTNYQRRLDLQAAAEYSVRRNLDATFQAALRQALATARSS
ncbi:MAG: hypothetical protein ACK4F7_00460 [Inhella sp.]